MYIIAPIVDSSAFRGIHDIPIYLLKPICLCPKNTAHFARYVRGIFDKK
jgi:hypothetical protein